VKGRRRRVVGRRERREFRCSVFFFFFGVEGMGVYGELGNVERVNIELKTPCQAVVESLEDFFNIQKSCPWNIRGVEIN
jgi:hypothetical protein